MAFAVTFATSKRISARLEIRTEDMGIVRGPATHQLSAKAFRDVGTNNGHRGDISFADYATTHTGGWWTNKRTPATVSNVQQAILYRRGRSMQTAACPHWNEVTIDDS